MQLMAYGMRLGNCGCLCGASIACFDALTGELIWKRDKTLVRAGGSFLPESYMLYEGGADDRMYVTGGGTHAESSRGQKRYLDGVTTRDPQPVDILEDFLAENGHGCLSANTRNHSGIHPECFATDGHIWENRANRELRKIDRDTNETLAQYLYPFGQQGGLQSGASIHPRSGGGVVAVGTGRNGLLQTTLATAHDSDGAITHSILAPNLPVTPGDPFMRSVSASEKFGNSIVIAPGLPGLNYGYRYNVRNGSTLAFVSGYKPADEGEPLNYQGASGMIVKITDDLFVSGEVPTGFNFPFQSRWAAYDGAGMSQQWTNSDRMTSVGHTCTDGTDFYVSGGAPGSIAGSITARVQRRSGSDGSVVWEQDLPRGNILNRPGGVTSISYAGPALVVIGDLKEPPGSGDEIEQVQIMGLDSTTGEILWVAQWREHEDSLAGQGSTRPASVLGLPSEGLVYVTGPYSKRVTDMPAL